MIVSRSQWNGPIIGERAPPWPATFTQQAGNADLGKGLHDISKLSPGRWNARDKLNNRFDDKSTIDHEHSQCYQCKVDDNMIHSVFRPDVR